MNLPPTELNTGFLAALAHSVTRTHLLLPTDVPFDRDTATRPSRIAPNLDVRFVVFACKARTAYHLDRGEPYFIKRSRNGMPSKEILRDCGGIVPNLGCSTKRHSTLVRSPTGWACA